MIPKANLWHEERIVPHRLPSASEPLQRRPRNELLLLWWRNVLPSRRRRNDVIEGGRLHHGIFRQSTTDTKPINTATKPASTTNKSAITAATGRKDWSVRIETLLAVHLRWNPKRYAAVIVSQRSLLRQVLLLMMTRTVRTV